MTRQAKIAFVRVAMMALAVIAILGAVSPALAQDVPMPSDVTPDWTPDAVNDYLDKKAEKQMETEMGQQLRFGYHFTNFFSQGRYLDLSHYGGSSKWIISLVVIGLALLFFFRKKQIHPALVLLWVILIIGIALVVGMGAELFLSFPPYAEAAKPALGMSILLPIVVLVLRFGRWLDLPRAIHMGRFGYWFWNYTFPGQATAAGAPPPAAPTAPSTSAPAVTPAATSPGPTTVTAPPQVPDLFITSAHPRPGGIAGPPCSRCRIPLRPGSTFCCHCGKEVDAASAPAAPPTRNANTGDDEFF